MIWPCDVSGWSVGQLANTPHASRMYNVLVHNHKYIQPCLCIEIHRAIGHVNCSVLCHYSCLYLHNLYFTERIIQFTSKQFTRDYNHRDSSHTHHLEHSSENSPCPRADPPKGGLGSQDNTHSDACTHLTNYNKNNHRDPTYTVMHDHIK